MFNKAIILAFICVVTNTCNAMLYDHSSTSRATYGSFSIPKDPYPSNTLIYKLKGFVRNIINGTSADYYKARVKEIVNEDIEEHSSEDSEHLHWILLYCTELADDSSTSDFYDEIESAITERVSM